MTIDTSRPVQTRDGRKARILATGIKNENGYSIAAVVTNEDGDEAALTFTADGRQYIGGTTSCDLVNVPERRVVETWHVVYDGDGLGSAVGRGFSKQNDAMADLALSAAAIGIKRVVTIIENGRVIE